MKTIELALTLTGAILSALIMTIGVRLACMGIIALNGVL